MTARMDFSPCLMAFLPFLYLAWADDVLTPSEIKFLRQKIEAEDWICKEDKSTLYKLIDPQNSPSVQQLQEWKSLIKEHAPEMSDQDKINVADLGFKLANITSNKKSISKLDINLDALRELEDAMGVIGQESVREMLDKPVAIQKKMESFKPVKFDLDELKDLLDGRRADLKDKVRILLSDPAFKLTIFEDKNKHRDQAYVWCKLLADQGYGAIAYPESGGGKADMEGYFTIFEILAYHDISTLIKFGVQFGLFGGSIAGLGTEKHFTKYLPQTGSLELPGCFAMTENGHGSNVKDIETTATFDPAKKAYIINTPNNDARKTYIGNAAVHGQMASVFAQLISNGASNGVHAFLVPIRNADGDLLTGVRIEDNGLKLGLNGVDNGQIWFDNVEIPMDNLLNKFGEVSEDGTYTSPIPSQNRRFFTMLGTLVGGRVGVPLAGLSAAKKALTIAIRYANQRRQFATTEEQETLIMDYPTHQRRLMPLLAKAYAFDFAHKYVLDRFINKTEEDAREIEALAAGIKALSTWNTTKTIQECREACGGAGYIAENQFANLKADTDIFTTFEGDNTVLLQLVAKGRLTEFKKEMGKMDFMGVVKFISNQASLLLTEMNPIIKRNTSSEHLFDYDFHLQALKYREDHLLMTVARRLQKKIKAGIDSAEAFLQTQNHLLVTARAYMDRVILESFHAGIQDVKDEELKVLLNKMKCLYALYTIEQSKDYYLEHDYMEGVKTKQISKLVSKLAGELRHYSVSLTDAFQIPNSCITAPIAQQS